MAFTPTDPTKAEVRTTQVGDQLAFDFYIPRGNKGDPGGIVDGTILGNADLNTIVTTGLYRQSDSSGVSGSLINNYPVAGSYGVLLVTKTGGTDIMQQFTRQSYNTNADGRQIYIRNKSNNVWSPWRIFSSTRVDQTAGRAVYMWDDVNTREQLVHGDTGWRIVTPTNGNATGWLRLRRIGYTVYLWVAGLDLTVANAVTTSFYTMPTGFRSGSNTFGGLPGLDGTAMTTFEVTFDGLVRASYLTGSPRTTNLSALLQFPTTESWPTTLPGTATGVIPNS